MRPLAPLALLAALSFAACSAPPPGSWQKPGADQPTVDRDIGNCRAAAQAEALRQYPYSASAPAGLGAGGVVAAQQRDDTNRATVEAAHFNDCMLARGYKRG